MRGELRRLREVEFAQQVFTMFTGSRDRNRKVIGNFAICKAFRDQFEDGVFPSADVQNDPRRWVERASLSS